MRRAFATIMGWIARAVRGARERAPIDTQALPAGPPSAENQSPSLPPVDQPDVSLSTAAHDGKPKPVASRHHPSRGLWDDARLASMAEPNKSLSRLPLSLEERQRLVHSLRQMANAPSLSQEQREEALRHANNLLAAGRIRQQIADRNQHPTHPTVQ